VGNSALKEREYEKSKVGVKGNPKKKDHNQNAKTANGSPCGQGLEKIGKQEGCQKKNLLGGCLKETTRDWVHRLKKAQKARPGYPEKEVSHGGIWAKKNDWGNKKLTRTLDQTVGGGGVGRKAGTEKTVIL